MSAPVRVLVADDSAFARKVIRTVLTRSPQIEVVGTARDGLDTLEQIDRLRPDVVTLDLLMPNLDGVGVLRAAPADTRFVVVSLASEDSEQAVSALQAGALALVRKPTALATDRLYEIGEDLVREVVAAAAARPTNEPPAAVAPPGPALVEVPPLAAVPPGVIVLGTSTGGPQALSSLVPRLPGDLSAPVVVALHIPAGYTQSLARRLDDASALQVVEAEQGLPLLPGMVAIGPGGRHVSLARAEGEPPTVRLDRDDPGALHRPSVDLLFQSAAECFAGAVLAVVLTGMGDDGLLGATAIRDAGGVVVAEAESSCIVYGMPRAVIEANVATKSAPLADLPSIVASLAGRRGRRAGGRVRAP